MRMTTNKPILSYSLTAMFDQSKLFSGLWKRSNHDECLDYKVPRASRGIFSFFMGDFFEPSTQVNAKFLWRGSCCFPSVYEN